MADDKETARKDGEPVVVFTRPDVCKSPIAPVPYPIFAPLDRSILVTPTVRATSVPTFNMNSRVAGVIGDEAGVGMGVVSGTHAGAGWTWPVGSSCNVRSEKAFLVRNNDPFMMNGGNTTGKLVYQPGGAARARIDAAGRPTNSNPPLKPTKKEQGWLDWATDKAAGAWNATSDAAGKAYDFGKQLNEDYAIVPRALGGLQAAGGVGEMSLGALGLAAPTGITQVAGGVAVVHGADNAGTGLRQLWSGQYQDTLTKQAATGAARALGASEGAADAFGNVTDLATGIAAPATVAKGLLSKEAQALAKQEAMALEKAAAKKEAQAIEKQAAKEGVDGVRVLKKPARPDTSKVKYPDDMSPYKKADGTWDWPANKGFAEAPTEQVLKPGTVLDRFGEDGGRFLSPAGTPFDGRALSPDSLGAPYKAFEVLKPLPVQAGPIAPAFGMPGGGTQFFTGGSSVSDLIRGGFIRQIP